MERKAIVLTFQTTNERKSDKNIVRTRFLLHSLTVVSESLFLKPEPTYAIMARRFPIWYFFNVPLRELRWGFFVLGAFSCPCNSFSVLIIHSDFLLWHIRSHIFLHNCFLSLTFVFWHIFIHSPPACW